MKIELVFFANAREYFGKEISLEISSMSELKEKLVELVPSSKELLQTCKFVYGTNVLLADSVLVDGQKIVVLPPSSGG